jgi:hypothetical protein
MRSANEYEAVQLKPRYEELQLALGNYAVGHLAAPPRGDYGVVLNQRQEERYAELELVPSATRDVRGVAVRDNGNM